MPELETRLREVDVPEPPLGFDPDEVADRAARHARRRSATVLLTAVAALAALFPTTVREPVVPAAAPVPSLAEQSRIRLALAEAVTRALPGVHDLILGRSSADSTGPARMSVTAEFVDAGGRPSTFQLTVRGARAAREVVPIDGLCTWPDQTPHCVRLPLPGGGVLVLSELGYKDGNGTFVRVGINGFLYRPDGSTVILTGGLRYPLSEEQVTKVITDPAFVLR
ncbi:hypothetical protein AMES_1779 [Amycolatopsis mediterranei S699]|uniref:Uncharacterized protein n=3 Tax=Amycolatopsis mediterranei TaxID=33910 RepID=A0A0H3CZ17_AMYMU|nr:hypothetical protein [Amycolatopsis mediterranei]ADJ43603.1 hypothetical protein AMED_1792 [Amycolatopsis mediterranei U32]AEK40309.1 hypothetical protein RAM_09095 [Amycolatopsis mediterranei S699]AFO75315.1 hypothetical protein AMES_1779 [Amycolatopsis mediterranei S699]AGT82444.1 hypothetical protein B737_1780 [Amycolatopsis mediterranei RB]KDO03802.1 hypothetical protein DV26_47350 [Amycolatopsis mediterranei]